DLLVQALGRNIVQLGQVSIQHHFLPADEQNRLLDPFDGNEYGLRHATNRASRKANRTVDWPGHRNRAGRSPQLSPPDSRPQIATLETLRCYAESVNCPKARVAPSAPSEPAHVVRPPPLGSRPRGRDRRVRSRQSLSPPDRVQSAK